MLVKCINNEVSALSVPDAVRNELRNWLPGGKASLTIDAVYIVYAVAIRKEWPWFFVADEEFSGYPISYSSAFFQVVDDRLSRHWRYRYSPIRLHGIGSRSDAVLLANSEWARDPMFYERLVDGDNLAVSKFSRVKSLMDVEFRHPSVTVAAIRCEERWLICPKCNDAWEAEPLAELVRCPKCSSLLVNPLSTT